MRKRFRGGAGRQDVKATTPEVQMLSQASSTARPFIAFAAAMLISAGAAFAAGDSSGDSSGTNSGNTATLPQKCKEGMVWDPNAKTLFGKGKCVNAADLNKSGTQKQGLIYDYGKQLAKAGEFELAIATLKLAPMEPSATPRPSVDHAGWVGKKSGSGSKNAARRVTAPAMGDTLSALAATDRPIHIVNRMVQWVVTCALERWPRSGDGTRDCASFAGMMCARESARRDKKSPRLLARNNKTKTHPQSTSSSFE
jgi:hypothetical protein